MRKSRILFVSWTLILTAGLLLPSESQVTVEFLDWPGADKLIHVLFLAIFSFLLCLNLKEHNLRQVILIGSLYGIIIESIQIIVPGRSFELWDWIADIAGTLLGYLFFLLIWNRKFSH